MVENSILEEWKLQRTGIGKKTQEVIDHYIDDARLRWGGGNKAKYVIMTQVK